MKNKIILFIIALVLFLPLNIKAIEYETLGLEEVCEKEGIVFNHSEYKESDKKVNVYLFRGDTCSHCYDFISYLESIVAEHGNYFNLVSYEVWNNEDNSKLMDKVAAFLGDSSEAVPYIVIGNKSWVGYAESINDDIIDTIEEQYKSNNRYDVMEAMFNTNEIDKSTLIIVILIVSLLFNTLLYFKTNNDKKIFIERIDNLEKQIKSMKKSK